MASAKQIAWRKKFAKMAKAGKFRKATRITKRNLEVVRENPQVFKGGVKGYKTSKSDSMSEKSNPHNDDGYYIVKEGSLFVLRQKRFKDRLDRGKKEHPHDVMAYGRTRAEINRMRKMITKS